MALKYESEAAYQLVSSIEKNNSILISTGNGLLQAKNTSGWNDQKNIEFISAINSALMMIGNALNNQNAYKSQMQSAIRKLEGN